MPRAITLQKTSDFFEEPRICPYDHQGFVPRDMIVICPQCKVAYHDKCWINNGNKCAVLGCPGAGPVEYPVPITQQVKNATAATIQSFRGHFPMTPRAIRLMSWIATLLFAHFSLEFFQVDGERVFSFWPILPITALFSVGLSTAYEVYQKKHYRGLVNDIAHCIQALVLGFLGITTLDLLLQSVLPDLTATLCDYSLTPQNIIITGLTFIMASAVHLGAWNNLNHFHKRTHVILRLITAIGVVFLGIDFLLEFFDLGVFFEYQHLSLYFYMAAAAGAGLSSTLNSKLGLWTGKPQPWGRALAGMLVTTFVFSGVGISLSQLVWRYIPQDALWKLGQDAHIGVLYQSFTETCAVIGAAYGSSGQARFVLLGVLRFLMKIVAIGISLAGMAFGGYISYAVAQDWWSVTEKSYLIGFALGGALVTLLILLALYKFFKDIIGS